MNRQSGIPDGVRRFLLEHVETYEQLNVLLFLHRNADRGWTAGEVAEKIGLPQAELAGPALEFLCTKNLLDVRVGEELIFRYAPAGLDTHQLVRDLARADQEAHGALLASLSENAVERIRTQAMRTFADAFMFRGPKKNG